jgi:hypothetical protein
MHQKRDEKYYTRYLIFYLIMDKPTKQYIQDFIH